MPVVAYSAWLDERLGLSEEVCDAIGSRTSAGEDCATLLDDPVLERAGLLPKTLLTLRRAWRRYERFRLLAENLDIEARDRVELHAARWAARAGGRPEELAAATRAILKAGRLRFHVRDLADPRAQSLAHLAESSHSCDELPPHRWLAARRGVADRLVWIEVVAPDDVHPDHARAAESAVLDTLGARAEAAAIDTAALGLWALLSRAPIAGAVGGVLVDRGRTWLAIVGGDHDGETAEVAGSDGPAAVAWLKERGIEVAGLARLSGSSAAVHRALGEAGIAAEPVREVGLMKQARQRSGPLRPAAAGLVAARLRDPVAGYAGLEPDELGLGEYLDCVDTGLLHAALADVRDVAMWLRAQGSVASRAGLGVSLNPMVRSLADLRPGMELSGVVANITHFGAFVELGLGTQGMIHISELADRFVEHPAEVVQVGERVRARVVDVYVARGRISLTLRSGGARPGQRDRDRRANSLSKLDALFKK